MKNLEELTTNANVADWVPADAYADLIMEASVCYGQLSGVITAIDYDLQACQGDTIQVRYAPARTAQGPITACDCLSATSSTLGTYPITVQAYGDYDLMCGFSLFKACGPVKDRILDEMAKGLAKKRDEDIWTQITTGFAPTHTATTNVAWSASAATVGSTCCFNGYDIYNKIIALQKTMQAAAVNPDYVIMNPEIAAHLYYKDNGNMPDASLQMPLLRFTSDGGNVASIAGMKVIESCNASEGTDTSGATLAVVIDSSRAVGEAWGKRPSFHEFYEVDCDRYKETVWMYWGTSELDTNAIGHVLNV